MSFNVCASKQPSMEMGKKLFNYYSRVGLLPGFSGFLPQTKNMQMRLFGDSKLPTGVNVRVNHCLCLYISPLIDWQPVQV